MNGTSPGEPFGAPIDIVLSNGQKDVVISIRLTMSCFSLVGSLFVLALMIKYKKYFGPHRLILLLTLMNLGEAITNLLSFGTFNREAQHPALCYFQGLTMQFFQVAAFCWSAAIAVNLWLVVVRQRLDVDAYQGRHHIVTWTVTLLCTIIPNFTAAYGPANVWCWINKDAKGGNVYRFTTFFVPFYIAWFIIVVGYVWIYQVARKNLVTMRNEDREKAEAQIARLRYYPIIFVVMYIPATINRVYNWISDDDIYVLFILQALTAPAVGFVNALAYGLDRDVRNVLANVFIRRGMCSYCLGDVLHDEDGGGYEHSGGNSDDKRGDGHYDEDDIIEGVLDDRGAVAMPNLPDAPVDLEDSALYSSHRSHKTPSKRYPEEEEDDTVNVDF